MLTTLCFDFGNTRKKVAVFRHEELTEAITLADDSPETVQKRLDGFRAQTAPLKEYYAKRGLLRPVNGVGDLETIASAIRKAIGA